MAAFQGAFVGSLQNSGDSGSSYLNKGVEHKELSTGAFES